MTHQSDELGSVTVLPVARVRRQAKKWGTRLFVGVSVALVAGLMLVTQILPDGTMWLSAHESLILALLIPTIIALTIYFFWGLSSPADSVTISGAALRLAGTQVDLSQATVRFASWERPGAGKVGVVLTVDDAVHVLHIGGAGPIWPRTRSQERPAMRSTPFAWMGPPSIDSPNRSRVLGSAQIRSWRAP